LPILQAQNIPINVKGEFAPPDEWVTARDLANYGHLISANQAAFSSYMAAMIEKAPETLEKCTVRLTLSEYALLLGFAGQDVYDFFVRDHRFGPPPRGRKYRSNVRGEWVEKSGNLKIHRPDNALLALRRRIEYYTDMGADVADLKAEYLRREKAIAEGRPWTDGMPGLVRGGAIQTPDRPKGRPGKKPAAWHLVFRNCPSPDNDAAAPLEGSPDPNLEMTDATRD
jgi:hypothetical protein